MKFFTVSDNELHGLSSMTAGATFCFSLSMAFLGISIGIWTSKAYADPRAVTPAGDVLGGVGAWVSFGMFAVLAVFSLYLFCRSKGDIDRIKSESSETFRRVKGRK